VAKRGPFVTAFRLILIADFYYSSHNKTLFLHGKPLMLSELVPLALKYFSQRNYWLPAIPNIWLILSVRQCDRLPLLPIVVSSPTFKQKSPAPRQTRPSIEQDNLILCGQYVSSCLSVCFLASTWNRMVSKERIFIQNDIEYSHYNY
jgi:hypothetical protein